MQQEGKRDARRHFPEGRRWSFLAT